MEKRFIIEERVGQDIKLLTVSEQFLGDVAAIAKKHNLKRLSHEEAVEAQDQYYSYYLDNESGEIRSQFPYDLNKFEYDIEDYENDIKELVAKYKLTDDHSHIIDLYVRYGYVIDWHRFSGKSGPVTEDNIDEVIEEHERKEQMKKDGYTVIKVYPNTTKEDVIDEWQLAQRFLNNLFAGATFSRKHKPNLDRDLEIYRLRKIGLSDKKIASQINAKSYHKLVGDSEISLIIKRLKESSENFLASRNSEM